MKEEKEGHGKRPGGLVGIWGREAVARIFAVEANSRGRPRSATPSSFISHSAVSSLPLSHHHLSGLAIVLAPCLSPSLRRPSLPRSKRPVPVKRTCGVQRG